MAELLRITPQDNVAVALTALSSGQTVTVDGIALTTVTDVPAGHKVALFPIKAGEKVIKYGFPIGYAKEDIPVGAHVHVHNLHTGLSGELTYEYHPTYPTVPQIPVATFMGYPRKDGRVGVRNELWILPTVGCVNDIARQLERAAQELVGGSVECVCAFPHPYGCSQMGDDQENTRTILADLATHPNVGGVLVLGLGCENSSAAIIEEHMGDYDKSRVRFLVCQQVEDEFAEAMKLLRELADNMRDEQRVPCPASKLVIGLKCGGSDGFSGITANPVIGGFSDLLCGMGGTTILTEVPEMFGAETILMDRCNTPELFDKTVRLINDFKRYFEEHHQTIYENPSPATRRAAFPRWKTRRWAARRRAVSPRARCAGVWRARPHARLEPAVRARQRSCGGDGAGFGRRTDCAVLHGARHAVRVSCADAENRHEHATRHEEARLD